jgi:hypothetical protein
MSLNHYSIGAQHVSPCIYAKVGFLFSLELYDIVEQPLVIPRYQYF